MIPLKYAFIAEGGSDYNILPELVKRVAYEETGTCLELLDEENSKHIPNGSITRESLRIASRKIMSYETEKRPDLILCFIDQDKHEEHIKANVFQYIREVSPQLENRLVVGVPNPHLEGWLLSDHDTVKNIFGFRTDQRLPHRNRLPKAQLNAFSSESSDITLFPRAATQKLVEDMRMKTAYSQNRSFRYFVDDLKNKLNNINT